MTWIFLRWTQIKLYLHHEEWAINPLLSENSNQQEFINCLLELSLPDLLFYSVDGKLKIARMDVKANISNSMGIFVIMNDHSMNHDHVCDMNDHSMNPDHASLWL